MRYIYAACALMAVSGCVSAPSVQYSKVVSQADMDGMSDSFYLRRTTLEVSATDTKKKDASGKEVVVTDVNVNAVPAEHQAARYAIGGKRTLRSDTRVNLTKIENTDLINSIGTETTDTTVTTIQQAGGVISNLIAFVGFGSTADTPCVTEKLGKLKFNLDPSKAFQDFDGGTRKCIRVTYGPLPQGSLPTGDWPLRQDTRFFYFAACRDATVRIAQSGAQTIEEKIKISDPNHLQYVRFPNKGKITHHSSCGISVVTEPSPTVNPADIVGALQAQGKAISDALKAARNDDK